MTPTVHVKTKTKTECLKDPTYCYIKYHILSGQQVNFSIVKHTRPDLIADLILELAFLFTLFTSGTGFQKDIGQYFRV